jgi:hypothetical protein
MQEKERITLKYRDLAGEPGNSPYDSINYLLDRDDFPVVFGHKLVKLASVIIPEMKHIDTVYARLIRKYGKLTEDKSQFIIEKGSEAALKFSEEYEQFLDQEVVLEVTKLDLADISEYKIKPAHLHNLRHFIKD